MMFHADLFCDNIIWGKKEYIKLYIINIINTLTMIARLDDLGNLI